MQLNKKKIKSNFIINPNVFIPTGTSQLIIEAAKKIIKPEKKILDLGCGSGIIGISLAKHFKIKSKIYFSDISKKACHNTLQNCKKFKIKNEIKIGSILKPWSNYKFDYIISDVAAIAEKVSKISPWYKNCINNAGQDGTKHILEIIKNIKKYLNKNGIFIFPIISLSNEKKIIKELKKEFKYYKKIKSQIWPFPLQMSKKIGLLKQLKKQGIINYENKLGILTFKTDIYLAKNNEKN